MAFLRFPFLMRLPILLFTKWQRKTFNSSATWHLWLKLWHWVINTTIIKFKPQIYSNLTKKRNPDTQIKRRLDIKPINPGINQNITCYKPTPSPQEIIFHMPEGNSHRRLISPLSNFQVVRPVWVRHSGHWMSNMCLYSRSAYLTRYPTTTMGPLYTHTLSLKHTGANHCFTDLPCDLGQKANRGSPLYTLVPP